MSLNDKNNFLNKSLEDDLFPKINKQRNIGVWELFEQKVDRSRWYCQFTAE